MQAEDIKKGAVNSAFWQNKWQLITEPVSEAGQQTAVVAWCYQATQST